MNKKEIVLFVGYPAAGKSTYVEKYVKKGYYRLNRDDLGISLQALADKLNEFLGHTDIEKFVLDNTYPSIASRKPIIDIANKYGIAVQCLHMTTSIENSQFNSATRIIRKHGKLVELDKIVNSQDTEVVPPAAIFKYRKAFEKPTIEEGFTSVKIQKFVRKYDRRYNNRAIILDYDGTLRKTKSGNHYPTTVNDIEILPNITPVLKAYEDAGYLLLGVSNQSGIGKGVFSENTAITCFEKTNELIGLNIDFSYCPHFAFPLKCYCRKPMPGLGVEFIEKYKLDPSQCIMVGDQTSDATFAKRCGFEYREANEFFTDFDELKMLDSVEDSTSSLDHFFSDH